MLNNPEKPKTLSGSTERRKSVRYPIAGAVSMHWKTAEGSWREAGGMTRNIGKSGVFVECEGAPPVGSRLKLVITLPTQLREYGSVCLCGVGEVRHRRRDTAQTSGFGARAQFQLDLPMSAGRPQ
jgi:hypothetical protein